MSITSVGKLLSLDKQDQANFVSSYTINKDEPDIVIDGNVVPIESIPPIASNVKSPIPQAHDVLNTPPVSTRKPVGIPPILSSMKENIDKNKDEVLKSIKKTLETNKVIEKTLSVKRYEIQLKFKELIKEDNTISMPPDETPIELWEEYYNKSYKIVYGRATIFTWHIYMLVIFFVIEYVMTKWIGVDMEGFAMNQITIIDTYNYILKDMGDPGGISPQSGWSPLVKLIALGIVHTVVFFIGKRMYGTNGLAPIQRHIADVVKGLGGSSGISESKGIIEGVMGFLGAGGNNNKDDIATEPIPAGERRRRAKLNKQSQQE